MDADTKRRLDELAIQNGLSRNTVRRVYHWFRRKFHKAPGDVGGKVLYEHILSFMVRKGMPSSIRELEGEGGDGKRAYALVVTIARLAEEGDGPAEESLREPTETNV